MSFDQFRPLASEPEVRQHLVKFVGGSAAVTKVYGSGITVTYTSTGVVTLTWTDNPGTFIGLVGTFQATTPGNVKSYVLVPGAYSSTAGLALNLYESGSLTDLAALEWLTCIVLFKAIA
jgi:hypothetical protein